MNRNLDSLRKPFVLMAILALGCQAFIGNIQRAFAYSAGVVVINEVGWAGTLDSANDEWIELYNTSKNAVDLSGWTINDNNGTRTYTIDSGEISPYGYFLILDNAQALTGVRTDKIIPMSLVNSGASLVLSDNTGAVMDTVNGAAGSWFGGNSTSKASMEKIDPSNKSDVAANWATALAGNGAKGRLGSSVLGTPGSTNSVFAGASTKVSLEVSGENFQNGDTVTVAANISGASELFAYGFKINYDPAVANFAAAQEGTFLNNGEQTTFDSALENGVEGSLVVAGTRISNPPVGADGAGNLFTLTFDVIGASGNATDLNFVSGESFISDISGDVPAGFEGGAISVGMAVTLGSVQDLQSDLGADRYSLELSWLAPATGADKYIVKRKNSSGDFVQIGETTSLSFVDKDSVTGAGKLVPTKDYEYQIIPVKAGVSGLAATIIGKETRGLKGDMTRDDKVNGRDLEKLARLYGLSAGDTNFDPLFDTNFDGIIDGSDLIDLGADFGKTY
jgi:hypothetical protein